MKTHNNQDKTQKIQRRTLPAAIGIGMGIGTFIGLLIGIWQAATSGAWWQVLLWIIIGWMAGSVAGSLGTLALMGAIKELVIYSIGGGIGALIGTWMLFRTLAIYPNSAIWAWVCVLSCF
jgi:Fe2+ transport system protein B